MFSHLLSLVATELWAFPLVTQQLKVNVKCHKILPPGPGRDIVTASDAMTAVARKPLRTIQFDDNKLLALPNHTKLTRSN